MGFLFIWHIDVIFVFGFVFQWVSKWFIMLSIRSCIPWPHENNYKFWLNSYISHLTCNSLTKCLKAISRKNWLGTVLSWSRKDNICIFAYSTSNLKQAHWRLSDDTFRTFLLMSFSVHMGQFTKKKKTKKSTASAQHNLSYNRHYLYFCSIIPR